MAAIAVFAPACGSTPLSVTQLRQQAGQVCQRAGLEASRIPTPTTPAGGGQFLQRGVFVVTSELTGLRSLRPPSEVANEYSTAVGALAQQLEELRATSRTFARSGDPALTLRSLQRQLNPLQKRENSAWRALDIPACEIP